MKFTAIICCMSAGTFAQDVCPRPEQGVEAGTPVELRSANGSLEATLFFRTAQDQYSQVRYCYVTPDGAESPTLRVNPGDTVLLHLKNEAGPAEPAHAKDDRCASAAMTPQSTNLHFHGLSIPPACHQDDVLRTLIAPGSPAYDYRFTIPANQTPGLYWYHPHPHGFTEGQVLGGASGALIVNGIEKFRPEIAGLHERLLILRDQLQPGQQLEYMDPDDSEKDVSVNFVPVITPWHTPALITMPANGHEFWRVLNASADTYFDLQLLDSQNQPQPLDLAALDGVPLRQLEARTHILLSPGNRAEFLVSGPRPKTSFELVSLRYQTGPDGENNPPRELARILPSQAQTLPPQPTKPVQPEPIEDLTKYTAVRTRKLYLSEDRRDLADPSLLPQYYVTVEGAAPKVYDMMSTEPNIIAEQGTVEDWIVENRARETHTFHIHQLHFQLLERDGRQVTELVTMDTVDLPFWDGAGPYPSVKLRMDFRSPLIVGDFVYHCHILEHEDNGMMGRIRVVHGK